MSEPLVTVITGFYNRGHILERTVDSLLAQTYPNLEIIVFDDCSKDDTRQRLEAYRAKADPRLVIIEHEKNLGFTQGMINAIGISRGKYIAVQGSGDVSLPDRIALQVQAMEADPSICVAGSFYDNVIEDSGIVRPRKVIADDANLQSMMISNVFSHGEVMMRKDTYLAAGGYRGEFRYSLDIDLWLRMITRGRFFTVKKVLYRRYIQFDGVSYEPAKFLTQARLSIIACRLAAAGPEEQVRLFEQLKSQGPDSLVELGDSLLQKRLMKACVRAAIWGDQKGLAGLAQLVQFKLASRLLVLFGRSFNTTLFFPFRRAVFKALNISAG